MKDLSAVKSNSVSGIINFFAIHHLSSSELELALKEWFRVLKPSGMISVAIWEGIGAIDYGNNSNIVAIRYTKKEIISLVAAAGFNIDRCVVEPVDDIPMDAVYCEATKYPVIC